MNTEKFYEVGNLCFKNSQMLINIDGKEHVFDLVKISPQLSKASDLERNAFKIHESGYGIHWYMLDEDLSIDGLLDIRHQPPQILHKVV